MDRGRPRPHGRCRVAQGDLACLCRRYNVRRLDLFGSAVAGHFEPGRSDLDFLVAFEPLAPAAYADAYFGLREGLEKLFGRDIDLVTESSLANPYFRRQVDSERRNLFAQHDRRDGAVIYHADVPPAP